MNGRALMPSRPAPPLQGNVQGPHSVKEYRSWLVGLERLSTLKPEMARELDEFSSMLLWRDGSSKRVPIMKVCSRGYI